MLPQCKVVSLSILATFLQFWSILLVFFFVLLSGFFVVNPILRRYKFESSIRAGGGLNLSWLTIDALGNNASAVRWRTLSTYYFFGIYTIFLTTIMLICNLNPGLVTIPGVSGDIIWADLEIVKRNILLNIIIGCTIGIGTFAFIVDYFFYSKLGRVIHENMETFKNPVRGYWAAFKLTPQKYRAMYSSN